MTEAEKELIEAALLHRPEIGAELYLGVVVSKELASAVKRVRAEREPQPRWTTAPWIPSTTDLSTITVHVLDNGEHRYWIRADHARILVDALNAKEGGK